MLKRIRTFLFYWLPLITYLALIFFVSHLSDPTGGRELPFGDKVAHFLEYFPLPFLFWRALKTIAVSLFQTYAVWMGVLASFLYAVSDEIHQAFIPERQQSIYDLGADGLGILVGAFAFYRFQTYIQRKKSKI